MVYRKAQQIIAISVTKEFVNRTTTLVGTNFVKKISSKDSVVKKKITIIPIHQLKQQAPKNADNSYPEPALRASP